MIDFSRMRNEEIVRNVWRALYRIICEHVKNCDDENALEHVKNFMEGVSWTVGFRSVVTCDGEVYVYLKCVSLGTMNLYTAGYKVIDFYHEIKALRKSINRHYHKMGVRFNECD